MYNNAIPALIDAISEVRSQGSEDCVYAKLKVAVEIAIELSPSLPGWFAKAEINNYDDTDCMLDNLSKLVNILYNEKDPVCVMSPDLFLARTGHERVGKHYQSAIYTTPRGMRADDAALGNLTAIFIQADRDMPQELSLSPSAVVLLCPSRFNTAQLSWVGKHIHKDSKVILLEVDHADGLATTIRNNDKKALEFMIARWELEKDKVAKDSQVDDILTHLEAMALEVDYGTGA